MSCRPRVFLRGMAMIGLDLPRVIGHRGAAAHAPENTLAGFRWAAAHGVRWVEFDVRLSRDCVPVVIHDGTLRRTTNGRGRVARKSARELSALDAGSWFSSAHAGEAVPTLETALGVLAELGLGANLEIKPEPASGARAAREVAAALTRAWRGGAPVLVSSFDWGALATLAAEAPCWPLGLLMRRPPRDWRGWARRLGVSALHVGDRYIDRLLIAELKESGLPVLVYTVERADRARRLFGWGVDGVFSDHPARLAAAL